MLNKIIIIIFAIILVSIIFPQKSSAISFKNIADSAGKVLDNIFALLNSIEITENIFYIKLIFIKNKNIK